MRGFTIFFAVLVGSLALSLGVSIFDLTIRELDLSQTATQSQRAIFAADVGAECALYWDYKYNLVKSSDADWSAFATSGDWVHGGIAVDADNVTCRGQEIALANVIVPNVPDPLIVDTPLACDPPNPNAGWCIASTPSNGGAPIHAITFFQLSMGSSINDPCALVSVYKVTDNINDPPDTIIVSRGYNTCNSAAPLRLERTLELTL